MLGVWLLTSSILSEYVHWPLCGRLDLHDISTEKITRINLFFVWNRQQHEYLLFKQTNAKQIYNFPKQKYRWKYYNRKRMPIAVNEQKWNLETDCRKVIVGFKYSIWCRLWIVTKEPQKDILFISEWDHMSRCKWYWQCSKWHVNCIEANRSSGHCRTLQYVEESGISVRNISGKCIYGKRSLLSPAVYEDVVVADCYDALYFLSYICYKISFGILIYIFTEWSVYQPFWPVNDYGLL